MDIFLTGNGEDRGAPAGLAQHRQEPVRAWRRVPGLGKWQAFWTWQDCRTGSLACVAALLEWPLCLLQARHGWSASLGGFARGGLMDDENAITVVSGETALSFARQNAIDQLYSQISVGSPFGPVSGRAAASMEKAGAQLTAADHGVKMAARGHSETARQRRHVRGELPEPTCQSRTARNELGETSWESHGFLSIAEKLQG